MTRTPGIRVGDPSDQAALRSVLGRFATGVAVLTAADGEGRAVGMTVNSFTSVSMDPPLVLACVSRRSRLHPVFRAAEAVAVNVLGEQQLTDSWRFASQGLDRFGSLRPRRGATGVPLLPEALAVIECAVERRVEAGDHDVLIGRVAAMEESAAPLSQPLVFYGGAYRTLNTDREWWSVALE